MGRTRLSERELVRGEVLGRVKAGSLSLQEASAMLGLSYRQCKRLMKRYRADGGAGLQHGHCGRVSNQAHEAEFRARVLKRVEERYGDFGPTLAAEHLASDDRLEVHPETLRQAGRPILRKRKAHRRGASRRRTSGSWCNWTAASTSGWRIGRARAA